jgi:hypothetical protein
MLHLEFTKQPYPEATANGMLRLRGAFSVGLDGKADEESVRLRLRLASPVLEDDGQEGDDLPLKIQAGVPADIDVEDSHLVRFFINRGKKAHFIFESEEYDPNWSVRVRPEIDLEEAR